MLGVILICFETTLNILFLHSTQKISAVDKNFLQYPQMHGMRYVRNTFFRKKSISCIMQIVHQQKLTTQPHTQSPHPQY